MQIATIKVSGVRATPCCLMEIPAGMIGATIRLNYADPIWDGLSKTVVFQSCSANRVKVYVTKDVVNAGEEVTVPAEVLNTPGRFLYVGIYGTSSDIPAVPTLWADLGRIRPAADPSGDTSTDDSLPVWAQLQEQIDEIRETGTGGGGNCNSSTYVVQESEPEDTSALWVDPSDDDDGGFQDAVNTALAQAKASGEFDGQPGKDGVDGKDGQDYNLTDEDKTEIAEMASKLVEVPESSGGGIAVTGATVGQTVKISAVDENGVPTAWEAVDFPSGGEKEWKTISYDFSEEFAASITLELPDLSDATDIILAYSLCHDGGTTTSTTTFRIYADVATKSGSAEKWVVSGNGLYTTTRSGYTKLDRVYDDKAWNQSWFNGYNASAIPNAIPIWPTSFFYIMPITSGVLIKGTAEVHYR